MDLGVKSMPVTSSSASWNSGDVVAGQFPAGLKVLVVDDDPTCLRILEKMLKNCLYEVTTCNRAAVALKFLRDKKDGCDIVMSDVHMPDMDGFKLLEHVGLEMDLPVIMMSADDSKHVVMKGVTHGACDYLIKPVRIEALRNIWQHVVRKKKQEWKEKDLENSGCVEEKPLEDADCSSNSKKRKDEEEERDETCTLKKPRVVWSVDLHQQFVIAVNQLGIDKAVPKRILELMNVPGLTRENVASHLQKFRLYLRRLSGGQNGGLGMDAPFGAMTSLDLQALGASIDQRNVFNFERPKLRQQQQNNNGKQVNVQSPLMQSRTHHISNSPSSVVFSRIENVGGPHSISRGFVPPNYNNVEDWRSSNFIAPQLSTTNIIQGGGLDVSIEQEKRVGDLFEKPLSSNNIFGQEDLMSLLLKQQQVDFDHHDKLTHYS